MLLIVARHRNRRSRDRREVVQLVEETIKRLFPSTEGGQGANATKNTVLAERAVEQERNENPDRHTVASILRFNPSTVYRPKAGKRAKSSSSKAPKKQRTKASEADIRFL